LAEILAFSRLITPSTIALNPSVNLAESAICFIVIVTASVIFIAALTVSPAAAFF
jgi:hypothetical protein